DTLEQDYGNGARGIDYVVSFLQIPDGWSSDPAGKDPDVVGIPCHMYRFGVLLIENDVLGELLQLDGDLSQVVFARDVVPVGLTAPVRPLVLIERGVGLSILLTSEGRLDTL